MGAHLAASWVPDNVTLDDAVIDLRARPDRPPTRLTMHGAARLGLDGTVGNLALRLDQLAFDDVAALWPEGAGGGARSWVVQNVTAGMAREGQVALAFTGPGFRSWSNDAVSGLHLTGASGSLAGSDVTVHWLRPIPPLEHGDAMLRIIDPDTLRIQVEAAQQTADRPGSRGRLSLQQGSMVITGLSKHAQFGAIRVDVTGSVPDALALLSHRRLHLLSSHPVPLREPSGQVAADVFAYLPLDARVTMDEVSLEAHAQLSDLHLTDVAAGRALDNGQLNLSATGDGLTLAGSGQLAGIPAQIAGNLDFRAGPPGQVQQRFTVSARTDAHSLAAAGLDAGTLLAGPADLTATYARHRNGLSDIDIRAALDDAVLRVPPLGWLKPPGAPVGAHARLTLDRDGRLSRADPIEADGSGMALRASAIFGSGRDVALRLDRLVLGGTMAQGRVRFFDDGSVRASLSGPRLDLSGRFGRPAMPSGGTGPTETTPRTDEAPWIVDAGFDKVALAGGQLASNLRLHVENAAGVLRIVRLSAFTGPGKSVQVWVSPDQGGRAVQARVEDAGALLRNLGALDGVEGGRLSLVARYADQKPGRPLSGVAQLDDFKLRNAPVLAKVLQAVTLYGLVQALEGPGMTFTRLAAPFEYGDGRLVLDNARAFNPSLGLTAKGSIDIAGDRLDVQGTIVPAYAVNSVLGRVPLVGRLFSPEKGGGIIAARYAAYGQLTSPAVRVNPLSALTPGFLRGLFGR